MLFRSQPIESRLRQDHHRPGDPARDVNLRSVVQPETFESSGLLHLKLPPPSVACKQNMDGKSPPAVLTIAGSDSSGGAGIQVGQLLVTSSQSTLESRRMMPYQPGTDPRPVAGGLEGIHGLRVLRRLGHHRPHSAEHKGRPGRTPRTSGFPRAAGAQLHRPSRANTDTNRQFS